MSPASTAAATTRRRSTFEAFRLPTALAGAMTRTTPTKISATRPTTAIVPSDVPAGNAHGGRDGEDRGRASSVLRAAAMRRARGFVVTGAPRALTMNDVPGLTPPVQVLSRRMEVRPQRCIRRAGTYASALAIILLGFASVSEAKLKTRGCGSTRSGLPVSVRATRNVRCSTARHIISIVEGEDASDLHCYSGPGRFHPCHVEGFYCTMKSVPQTDISSARCTKGRRQLITGNT